MLARLSPVQKRLLDAVELIRERGWFHGIDSPSGSVCAAVAIADAGPDDQTESEALRRFATHLGINPNRGFGQTYWTEIPRWNDDPSRTADEVIKALQEAAL